MNKILKYVLFSLTVLAVLTFFFMLRVGLSYGNSYMDVMQVILVIMAVYCSLSSVMRYFLLPKTAEDKGKVTDTDNTELAKDQK